MSEYSTDRRCLLYESNPVAINVLLVHFDSAEIYTAKILKPPVRHFAALPVCAMRCNRDS